MVHLDNTSNITTHNVKVVQAKICKADVIDKNKSY